MIFFFLKTKKENVSVLYVQPQICLMDNYFESNSRKAKNTRTLTNVAKTCTKRCFRRTIMGKDGRSPLRIVGISQDIWKISVLRICPTNVLWLISYALTSQIFFLLRINFVEILTSPAVSSLHSSTYDRCTFLVLFLCSVEQLFLQVLYVLQWSVLRVYLSNSYIFISYTCVFSSCNIIQRGPGCSFPQCEPQPPFVKFMYFHIRHFQTRRLYGSMRSALTQPAGAASCPKNGGRLQSLHALP